MSAQACTQLKLLHRVDIHKMYKYAENKLCTRVRNGILKHIFVRKIGEIFKSRLIRLGFWALKRMRNTTNVDNSGCHGQFDAFYFI